MITLLEINKAINDTVKAAISGTAFSTVPLLAEEITESIERPGIKVEMEKSTNSKFNSCCRDKNVTINIYFFCANRHDWKIDNAKMQDILENAFLDGLYVNGAYITIEIEAETTDTVLILSFDVYLVELIPDTDISELMETLEFK